MARVAALLWLAFLLYWVLSARSTATTKARAGLAFGIANNGVMLLAGVLLAGSGLPLGDLDGRFVPALASIGAVGVALTAAGLAFAVWARVHLGRYWSAQVTVKVGHRLVCTGPYSLIRHPIYSGMLVALLGPALCVGEYRAVLAMALFLVGFWWKARREEVFLASEFGEEYAVYRQRTGMFAPRVCHPRYRPAAVDQAELAFGVYEQADDPRRACEVAPSGGALSPIVQVGLLAGPLLTMVDSSIVNVAVPSIAQELGSSLATAQWTVSGYLLAAAAALAASAYLSKRFGNRRTYLASLLGFTLVSALCALAPSIQVLIGLRVLQGALGAPLVPVAMNMLLGDRGAGRRMPPAAGLLLFLAPAVGPSLGGLLIPVAGWPAIFLVNVPIGLAGILGVLYLPSGISGGRDLAVRFDLVGLLLLASGLALTLYGASEGPIGGWLALGAWPFWASGIVLLALYVTWGLRRAHAAVELALLRDSQRALAVVLVALAAVVMFAILFLLPAFMQSVQGVSASVAGLALLPQGLLTGVGMVLADRLTRRRDVRLSAALGLAILTVSTAALLVIRVDTPAWLIALILSGRGLALGLIIQPLLLVMLGGLGPGETADANTLFNVTQRLGGSIGISLLATFFQVREQVHVERVLRGLGVSVTALTQGRGVQLGSGLAALPPAVRVRLAEAAATGLHDVVWLLVALSALGLAGVLLLHLGPETGSGTGDRTAGIGIEE